MTFCILCPSREADFQDRVKNQNPWRVSFSLKIQRIFRISYEEEWSSKDILSLINQVTMANDKILVRE